MIYDSFFFSSTPLFCLLHPRYHALVVCLLPISGGDERSKELSLTTTYNRDRAIECLKRAKIDNYKVSRTCRSFFFFFFALQLVIRSTRNIEVEREREREKERKEAVGESPALS